MQSRQNARGDAALEASLLGGLNLHPERQASKMLAPHRDPAALRQIICRKTVRRGSMWRAYDRRSLREPRPRGAGLALAEQSTTGNAERTRSVKASPCALLIVGEIFLWICCHDFCPINSVLHWYRLQLRVASTERLKTTFASANTCVCR